MLTFKPRQLAGHCVQLIAQRAHQLDGLGDIMFIHDGIVASLAAPGRRNESARPGEQGRADQLSDAD
jgi:hypothetical protein